MPALRRGRAPKIGPSNPSPNKRMLTRFRRAAMPTARRALRASVPLGARKRMSVWIGRTNWFPDRYYWSMELVRDLAERDPDAFHRFLWANHLAYAETYEVEHRFTAEQLHPTRRLLFAELRGVMDELGLDPQRIDSVLEVGCSLGYLLHHLETTLFRRATRLHGVDIDRRAIERGEAHLRSIGSIVELMGGDMGELDRLVGPRRYDIVLSAGTLMYLREPEAARVVEAMMARADRLVVLTGLAHPALDNARLERSGVRERDRTFIHTLDAMAEAAGGRVVARRWEGERTIDGNTVYFVFAVPARAGAAAVDETSLPESPPMAESA